MNVSAELAWAMFLGLVAAIGGLIKLSSRFTAMEQDITTLKGEMAGFRVVQEEERKLWGEIRERLVRIETRLEDRRTEKTL